MAVKKVKNPKVPRTRNNFTLTESAFWGFIRSTLRNASRWWKPIQQCKLNSRRAYKGTKKLQKPNHIRKVKKCEIKTKKLKKLYQT